MARNGQTNVCEEDFFDARELLRHAAACGTDTAMIFNYRFFDQIVRAQRVVSDRAFRRLTQATLFVNYACWSHCIDRMHYFGGRACRISALAGDIPYRQKDVLDKQLRHLEWEAQRAFEQYDEVDPRNSMVASELERRWNEKLVEVQGLKGSIEELDGRSRALTVSRLTLAELKAGVCLRVGRDRRRALSGSSDR